MITGLIGIVDNIFRVFRQLFFPAEIAVMDGRVYKADGTVESDLIEVEAAAGIIQIQ